MIPRDLRLALAITCTVLVSLASAACEKTPFLAPTGSSITLTTSTNAIAAGGTATIVAQVLESAGTPPHSGTQVIFTTTLGTVEPSVASTDAAGRATVTFRPNGANGVAIIAASSGGATTSSAGSSSSSTQTSTTGSTAASGDRNLRISVGSAAVGRVVLSANPAVLNPANFSGGVGTVSLAANVFDVNGNALAGVPVTFTTTAGTLSQVAVNTDANGNAFNTLLTSQAASVSAAVGPTTSSSSGSGGTSSGSSGGSTSTTTNNQATVNVTLVGSPVVAITLPTDLPSAGLPSTFTIKVTPASATGGGSSGGTGGGTGGGTTTGGSVPIRMVTVKWGDERNDVPTSLGSVSGDQVVSHTYSLAGSYVMTVTAEDIAGGRASVSTTVSVIEAPVPSVQISYSPTPVRVGQTVTFAIQVTVPRGLTILAGRIVFDDQNPTTAFKDLGGGTSFITTWEYTAVGTKTVVLTLQDSSGRSTTIRSTINVLPAI